MSIANIYTIREIEVTHATTPIYLVQAQQRSVDPSLTMAINKASGEPAPSWVSVMDFRPQISWETTEITRMLTLIDYQAGRSIASSATYTSFNAYFGKAEDLGLRQSTTGTCLKVATNRGLICPTELRVSQGGEATMSATIYNTSTDGTTSPWTITSNANASAATMEVDQKYTLGKCTLNNVELNGVVGWSCSFNCKHELVASDGRPIPMYVYIADSDPVYRIQLNDASYLSTIGATGVAVTSNTDLYLTALQKAGVRVADGTTAHIRHRITTGYATCGPVSAGGNTPATCEITITPYKSGSTFVTVATGVAIT